VVIQETLLTSATTSHLLEHRPQGFGSFEFWTTSQAKVH